MKNKKNRNTCKDADIFDPVSKPPNYFPPGKRSFTALAVVIAAIVVPAEASEKEKSHARHYAIAAQPLGDALTEFADQSDLKLVFDADLVRGPKSRGLSSTLTPEQGLDKLLDGTGFGYRFIGPGTVTIERLAQPAAKPKIAPAAAPQTRGSGDDSVQLSTISVTGEAEPQSLTTPSIEESREKLERVPGGTTLIEGERIREGAALTVNDALAYAPGVYVGDRTTGVAGGSRLSIRGSDVNSLISPIRGVKILRDGLPFTNANGASDIETIDLDAIQYIEVYRGANALEYGASNLGGAVNFVTPTGYTSDPLRVGMTLGTNGYVKPQISGGSVLGNGWDAFGSFSYIEFNGNRRHNEQELFYGYGNLGYRWNDRHETRLHVDVQDFDYEGVSAITKKQLKKNPHQNPSTGVPPTGFPAYRVDLRHTMLLDDGDRFDVGAYYFNKDYSFSFSNFGFFRDAWQDAGFSWRHQINGHLFGLKNRVIWGGLAQWQWINDRDFNVVNGKRGSLRSNERDEWNSVEAYVEDQLGLTDTFTLVLGGQVNYRKAAYEHRFGTLAGGLPNQADQDFFNFNPKLGFTWQAMPEMQLYGNLSRSAEPPPLSNLADIFLTPRRVSQTGSTVEIGTRGGNERFKWDLAFYHAWLNNEILVVPNPQNPTVFTTTNAGNTQHTGIELGLESIVPLGLIASDDHIRLRGSYTWSNFHFDDDPVLKDNRLPGIPEHNARFEALYQHPGGFYIGPNVTAVSSNWVDFTNTLAADAYALLGARVGWDDGKHWKVFVDGRNLTNERYAASVFVTGDARGQDVAQFNPGATRMVFGGFEYRY
ncbi:TonB-dependent receptor domain-containing protein [Methylocaldum gracile subsp. desertum]|uniref:TonB-dependent receptor domain-containing protein n=1 Tax=Methylocaldum sp. GT1BW TaxID=3438964 RepID=UPI003DA0F6E7